MLIHLVIAEEPLRVLSGAHVLSKPGAGKHPDSVLAHEFWLVGPAIRDLTGYRRDHMDSANIAVLRSVCVRDLQDIARMLYQSILKASSSRHHGTKALPRETDRVQHSRHGLIRRTRRCPQPVIAGQSTIGYVFSR